MIEARALSDPHDRRPRYQRIRDELRELVHTGACRPDDRLPSENELVRRFGVSRVTVRQAIDALREAGFVYSVQGKGSFFSIPKAVHDSRVLLGFHEAMAGKGYATSSQVISTGERRAGREVSEALQIARGTKVVVVRRVRCLDDKPVSLDVSYFPRDIGETLLGEDLGCDIFPLLERRCGVMLGRARMRIEAMPCGKECADELRLARGKPVLHIRRLTYGADRRPVDYEHLYCRGDAYQYEFELTRRRSV